MLALSVMDQSPIPSGSTSSDAIADTVALAIEAERLGYRRIWLAEHHNTRSMAGTAPEVLAAHIAGRTSRIRVGSGGVLLTHYSALKVAETFRPPGRRPQRPDPLPDRAPARRVDPPEPGTDHRRRLPATSRR